ncbi:hypothetical protein FD13_GL001260 [Levilactobacillus senmaizukei DSM 21775 = NBRC 103853]|uniref:GW domain-containing protein n=1 Tax=Levilactobacillus senmaizukei DSM 21775 = NBRC 103853 TaxID=1423803 RepID=A0A0R2DFV6_9LACO|nr:hypothetical protein [Levilactobacillus senmaizukei]KRN02944.1 hypothetical protein FD13_GL001260 [Levilactobacillus senmaizukei DSM 21775 = NBRC 103853]
MQSRLSKSLYLGLAALSLGAVATVSTANAASKAKVVSSKTLNTDPTTRNVQPNGKNALFTKPGTVKGAKTVASKKTMKKLAGSAKSSDYFRAYYQKVTNKGAVYYKVVSMNGKYRGYIYGGKKAGTFAGGIKKSSTTRDRNLPTNTTVYFTKPGTSNVTWSAPKYTQYKATKSVKDTKPYANDTLKITAAATKTREGSMYYYVTDAAHPSVKGWIYYKAVTDKLPASSFNDATDVKVNFKTTTGTTVSSTVLNKLNADGTTAPATKTGTSVATAAVKAADDNWGNALLKGTGYKYTAGDTMNQSALANAKTGDTIDLFVTTRDNKASTFSFYQTNGNGDLSVAASPLKAYTAGATAAPDTVVFPAASAFTGAEGLDFTAATSKAFLTNSALTKLYTPNYKSSNSQSAVDVYTVYTLSSTIAGTYGTPTKAFYTAETKTGTSPANATTIPDSNAYVTPAAAAAKN